ncbi:MAG: siphovirus Gp157 family protein [Steroidobacteraceae bacterium]
MSDLHLYEISERYRELQMLAESDELPPEVIRDTLEGIEGDWQEKAGTVAAYIQNIEVIAEAKKAASKAIAERARMLEKRAESLRQYLLLQFQFMGKTRAECGAFTLILKNNPQSVVIDDETALPAAYMVQPPAPPPKPDKKAIGQAIKLGVEVPGCHAEVSQRVDIVL